MKPDSTGKRTNFFPATYIGTIQNNTGTLYFIIFISIHIIISMFYHNIIQQLHHAVLENDELKRILTYLFTVPVCMCMSIQHTIDRSVTLLYSRSIASLSDKYELKTIVN